MTSWHFPQAILTALFVFHIYSKMLFPEILEDFYNLLRHRRFVRKAKNEVMTWQLCLFLRFALNHIQVTLLQHKSNFLK